MKPSVGLQLLRQEILGPEAFDDAFRTYIARWAYKHPAPADFFRTMEDASGHRLDWFWREWFVENPHFDQAIDGVRTRELGDTTQVLVAYGNRARGVLPIRARFTFSDGSTQDFDYPAEVWSTNTVRYIRRYSFVGKTAREDRARSGPPAGGHRPQQQHVDAGRAVVFLRKRQHAAP